MFGGVGVFNSYWVRAGMAASPVDKPLKAGYHRIELFKAEWEVPIYYQDIAAIGTGAYGTVW